MGEIDNMRIVIADGSSAADYVIKVFRKNGNQLTVINSRKDIVQYLVKSNGIPVIYGEPYKINILRDANIDGCDLFIALGKEDTDNFVSCLLAKKAFNARKCICTVNDPGNVELFSRLGIDSVISSTQILAKSIFSESSLEKFTKSMSVEDDKIVLTEILVDSSYAICGKRIMDINFPKTGTISCIYRKPNVIIPNGQTIIYPCDNLFVVTTPSEEKKIIDFVKEPDGK